MKIDSLSPEKRARALCYFFGLQMHAGTISELVELTGCSREDLLSRPHGEARLTGGFSAVRTCSLDWRRDRLAPKYQGNADFWRDVAIGYWITGELAQEKETLHEALASLGITSLPAPGVDGRSLYRGNESLGAFNASEGWKLVHRLRGELKDLLAAFQAADDAWTAAYEAICPARIWPGDFRFTDTAKGEPGSALRAAYDAFRAAQDSFHKGLSR